MTRSIKPSEPLREQLRQKVTEDGRGYDAIAEAVGIKGPTLWRFLNKPGTGCEALPRLLKLFGIDQLESMPLDDEQRELLRAFADARAAGRDGAALVAAFKTMTGVERVEENRPRPGPPKSRGTGER